MLNFYGRMMPLYYGSQLDEHRQVRHDASTFDVSHNFMRHLLTNDGAKLIVPGKTFYICKLHRVSIHIL